MSTWINDNTGETVGFHLPNTLVGDPEKEVQLPYLVSQSLTISSNKASATVAATENLLKVGSANLAAACTLTLTNKLPVGAKVYVVFKCGGTKYDVTVKDGEDTVATITGVASSTNLASFLWDGTSFLKI